MRTSCNGPGSREAFPHGLAGASGPVMSARSPSHLTLPCSISASQSARGGRRAAEMRPFLTVLRRRRCAGVAGRPRRTGRRPSGGSRPGVRRWAATRQNSPTGPRMPSRPPGGPKVHLSPSEPDSSQYTTGASSPTSEKAYGRVRWASQAMCRSRAVSGKGDAQRPADIETMRPVLGQASRGQHARSQGVRRPGKRAGLDRPLAGHLRRPGGRCASARRSGPAAPARPERHDPWLRREWPDGLPSGSGPPRPSMDRTTASSVCIRCTTTSRTVQPGAAEGASHCWSVRPARIVSSWSSSASRSSKIPEGCGEGRLIGSSWSAAGTAKYGRRTSSVRGAEVPLPVE